MINVCCFNFLKAINHEVFINEELVPSIPVTREQQVLARGPSYKVSFEHRYYINLGEQKMTICPFCGKKPMIYEGEKNEPTNPDNRPSSV